MRTMRPTTDSAARRRRLCTLNAGAALASTVLVALVAGCGGNSPSGSVAHIGASTSSNSSGSSSSSAGASGAEASGAQLADEGVKYANCMRAHGVAGYPDPKISKHGGEVSVAVAARPGPNFNAAQQACHKLLPTGGGSSQSAELTPHEQAQVLQVVACMRSHGMPNLPDPTFNGSGAHLPETVNRHSAAFKSAEQACQSLIPNALRNGG